MTEIVYDLDGVRTARLAVPTVSAAGLDDDTAAAMLLAATEVRRDRVR